MGDKKQHVYIIGSKGIPSNYGGFETFVDKLTEYHKTDGNIQYHVACTAENSKKSGIIDKHFEYNGARCFNIDVPKIGSAKAIYYDIIALKYAIEMSKENKDNQPIFYVLACRIGPFIRSLKKQIKELDGKLFVNPDGHEWMRAKWNYFVRHYWRYSERLMVKNADLLICDSKTIEKYIHKDYKKYNPKTTYIAYGTDLEKSELNQFSSNVTKWYKEKDICPNNYYLVVGRFVPENNYEIMIREFMKSNTKKDFVFITNIEKNKFYEDLKQKTHFEKDSRIKFVGTVYDQELLKYIRENAFSYIHGHEVGGTNPSLLEALASTKTNLLLDVEFNREVAKKTAIYWKKGERDLLNVIEAIEKVDASCLKKMEEISLENIEKNFTWDIIAKKYKVIFKLAIGEIS